MRCFECGREFLPYLPDDEAHIEREVCDRCMRAEYFENMPEALAEEVMVTNHNPKPARCEGVETMAIYTTFVEQEDRPNLRNHPNLWAVVDDSIDGGHIIAYCLHVKDAEYLKELLVYYGDKLAQAMKAEQEPAQ